MRGESMVRIWIPGLILFNSRILVRSKILVLTSGLVGQGFISRQFGGRDQMEFRARKTTEIVWDYGQSSRGKRAESYGDVVRRGRFPKTLGYPMKNVYMGYSSV